MLNGIMVTVFCYCTLPRYNSISRPKHSNYHEWLVILCVR